eukprot:4543747-Lingulodinium_polyedra.AAC.1
MPLRRARPGGRNSATHLFHLAQAWLMSAPQPALEDSPNSSWTKVIRTHQSRSPGAAHSILYTLKPPSAACPRGSGP